MRTNCLFRCGVVLLVADDQRSSFMNNVRLSFVRFALRSLYPNTLGVLFPQLGGLPPTGDLSVRCPWFDTAAVSK